MTPITLEWEDFLGWLMEQPAGALAGLSRGTDPIELWLNATRNGKWMVGITIFWCHNPFAPTNDLPIWARQFVLWSMKDPVRITRDQALAALRGTAT